MQTLGYRDGHLFVENVALAAVTEATARQAAKAEQPAGKQKQN